MKQLKRTLSLALALLLTLSASPVLAPSAAATETTEETEWVRPLSVRLDDVSISTENLADIVDGRTMIPIRCLAEPLGADVVWDAEARAAHFYRAGVEIIMYIGSTTAYVDGEPFEMDVAPYIVEGRTMIPARYISELFDQSVVWNAEERRVYVTENKALAGDTNLEAWALPMGSMLNVSSGRLLFGARNRGYEYDMGAVGQPTAFGFVYTYEWARYMLSSSWNTHSREDLINTVLSTTYYGHNSTFFSYVDFINSMTEEEYAELLQNASEVDAYMFPFTEQIAEKWGERGIIAWDLFRASNLVQWGYAAGYLTYTEALALVEPAALILQANFSSWEEAYENYLYGYNWWARNNALDMDIWEAERGSRARNLLENSSEYFDAAPFSEPIRGIDPSVLEGLVAEISQ